MEKLKYLLRQPEFHAILFCLCLVLFVYPLVLMSNGQPPGVVYLSLFGFWGAIILLIFFVTRSYQKPQSKASKDEEEGGVSYE